MSSEFNLTGIARNGKWLLPIFEAAGGKEPVERFFVNQLAYECKRFSKPRGN
jgi:hypothetical protein